MHRAVCFVLMLITILFSNFAFASDHLKDVVRKEDFEPVPSHSQIFTPGHLLFKTNKGHYDIFYPNCIDAQTQSYPLANSQIIEQLSLQIQGRVSIVQATAQTNLEKRTIYANPHHNTIPEAYFDVSSICEHEALKAQHELYLVKSTLTAQIQSIKCIKILGNAKAGPLDVDVSKYKECIQETEFQIPVGMRLEPYVPTIYVSDSLSHPAVKTLYEDFEESTKSNKRATGFYGSSYNKTGEKSLTFQRLSIASAVASMLIGFGTSKADVNAAVPYVLFSYGTLAFGTGVILKARGVPNE